MRKIVISAVALLLMICTAGCGDSSAVKTAAMMTGGDPDRGRATIVSHGCQTCHTIPGIRGADAVVGPPLNRMGVRSYIAGQLQNTPENMIRWLQNPPGVVPATAMPVTGLSEREARDVAAYLYTLR